FMELGAIDAAGGKLAGESDGVDTVAEVGEGARDAAPAGGGAADVRGGAVGEKKELHGAFPHPRSGLEAEVQTAVHARPPHRGDVAWACRQSRTRLGGCPKEEAVEDRAVGGIERPADLLGGSLNATPGQEVVSDRYTQALRDGKTSAEVQVHHHTKTIGR